MAQVIIVRVSAGGFVGPQIIESAVTKPLAFFGQTPDRCFRPIAVQVYGHSHPSSFPRRSVSRRHGTYAALHTQDRHPRPMSLFTSPPSFSCRRSFETPTFGCRMEFLETNRMVWAWTTPEPQRMQLATPSLLSFSTMGLFL